MDTNLKNSQLRVVIGTLIEAAGDKNEHVRQAVAAALNKLARKHPNDILEDAISYRNRNLKLPVQHLGVILRTMEFICQEYLSEITKDVVLHLIVFSIEEMTRSSDYLPDSQMPASGILVALGKKYCYEVMDGILKCFQPGIVPHYCILHTMGNLASANVFGIVPFIKATLGTMLPMMGMLRTDGLRQVFSFTLGKFSDAILEYVANIENAPDPSVKKDSFSTEISIAYDVLVNSWIHSRDPKVCEAVLNAVGPMFSVLQTEKVIEQVPKLVPALLNLYRRNIDFYPVTQCLATVLLVAVEHDRHVLESHLDNLSNALFEQICQFPDYAQPGTVKNHYEVLRCFDRIAGLYTNRVVEFLVLQLKNSEKEKIKALLVITHLINSSHNVIKERVNELILVLKTILNENSFKVKKVLLKAIVALAYKGYLNGETGKDFIEFIVRNSCSPGATNVIKNLDSNNMVEELPQTCANTLYLLATTVSEVEDTLWPLLLNLFLMPEYTACCAAVVKCLAHLATKRDADSIFTENSNKTRKSVGAVSGPHGVFGRCLALLGNPLESRRGFYILNFLKNVSGSINRHLHPLWEQKIPDLLSYLEDAGIEWQDKIWESLIMEFVSLTLAEIDEEKWTLYMGEKIIEQLPLYALYPMERGTLLKVLAVTSCHTSDKVYVNNLLGIMSSTIRQYSSSDIKSCSKAIGVCSRKHLSLVLSKLEILRKDELSRKSSRLLSFMKDTKHETELERVRITLLQCYGEVAAEAPVAELLPLIEHTVCQWVVQQLNVSKEVIVTEVALNTLGKIAEAFHPTHNNLHIVLHSRNEILNLIINQLNVEHNNNSSGQELSLVTTILKVAAAFIKLPPPLTSEERVSILKTCFTKVYRTVLLESKSAVKQMEKTGDELLMEKYEYSLELEDILTAVGSLVQEILLVSVCPSTLDEMFTLLEPWLSERHSQQRAAALGTLNTILNCYINNVKFGYETPTKFSQSGVILGRIAPRCTDPDMKVRHKATDCIYLVLCLAARYEGHSADYENEFLNQFYQIQKDIQTDDPQKLFKTTGDLAQVICAKLPQFQVIPFADSLLDGLMDSEPSSSSGASVILNVFLKLKGGELYHQVTEILNSILRQLANIHCVQTRNGSIRAVLALAHHHPKSVVSALLLQPVPYDQSVAECWMVLAQDTSLSNNIIEQFLGLISTTPLYEVQQDKTRIAVLLPLAAISAMSYMFSIASMQSIAIERFPELFSMFLIVMGCYVGISPPIHTPQVSNNKSKYGFVPNRNAYKLNPAKVAQDAFKAFLLCANCEFVAEALLKCTHMDDGESLSSFINMIPALVRNVCQYTPQSLPKLINCLNQYGTSSYEPQRITVAGFYAELVSVRGSLQSVLLESIITNLLNCLRDPSPVVRQLCMKGLASVSCLEEEQIIRHSDNVLSALVQGLDDRENGSTIPLEAMRGFSKMLKVVTENQVQNIQVTIALRTKPYFEKDESSVRAAAIRLFGEVTKRGGDVSKSSFLEQIKGNLVCFLLHLNDDDKSVVKACKFTLKQVCPMLGAEKINAMCQEHLNEDAILYYSNFIATVSKLLIEELHDIVPLLVINALQYVKSSCPAIRGNAAMFIGLLCGNSPSVVNSNVPLDTVCARLLLLLKDEDHGVRAIAAESLSCMFGT